MKHPPALNLKERKSTAAHSFDTLCWKLWFISILRKVILLLHNLIHCLPPFSFVSVTWYPPCSHINNQHYCETKQCIDKLSECSFCDTFYATHLSSTRSICSHWQLSGVDVSSDNLPEPNFVLATLDGVRSCGGIFPIHFNTRWLCQLGDVLWFAFETVNVELEFEFAFGAHRVSG